MANSSKTHLIDTPRLLITGFDAEPTPTTRDVVRKRKQPPEPKQPCLPQKRLWTRNLEEKAVQPRLRRGFPLFELPRELRDEVYDWMLQNTEVSFMHTFTFQFSTLDVAVLARYGACDLIFLSDPIWLYLDDHILVEAMELFYRRASFTIPNIPEISFNILRNVNRFEQRITPSEVPLSPLTLHHARKMVFEPNVLSPQVSLDELHQTIPLIEILRDTGSALRHLEIILSNCTFWKALANINRFPEAFSTVKIGVQIDVQRHDFGEWAPEEDVREACFQTTKRLLCRKEAKIAHIREYIQEREVAANVWWVEARLSLYKLCT